MHRLKARHLRQKFEKQGIHVSPNMLRGCYGKVRYQDYESAKERAELLGCKAYRCQFCKYFHFGHVKVNVRSK